MSSSSSTLQAFEIDSAPLRAISGGISGGVAAFIAYSTVDGFLLQVFVVGGLTLVFTLLLGVVYNTLTADE